MSSMLEYKMELGLEPTHFDIRTPGCVLITVANVPPPNSILNVPGELAIEKICEYFVD